jgi:hypothetical protein
MSRTVKFLASPAAGARTRRIIHVETSPRGAGILACGGGPERSGADKNVSLTPHRRNRLHGNVLSVLFLYSLI